jgi:hypothetical protein
MVSCKAWLKSIPLTNIAQAQRIVLDSLRLLAPQRRPAAGAPVWAMRDKVAFLLSDSGYSGKSRSAASRWSSAASNAYLA